MSTLAYPPHARPQPSQERLLWGCVAISLLLHALIVWQGRAVPSAPPPPQMKVNIRLEPKPAPPPPAPALPKVETPPPEPPRPEPPKPEPKPVPQPQVMAKAAPVEPKPAPKPVTPAPQVAPTPPAPVPAPSEAKSEPKADTAAAPAAPAVPVAPSTPGPVDNDLRAIVGFYQQQLAQQTEKRLRYPAEAQDQGWTGVATVRLRIDEKGMISGVDLVNSSGHEMLDNEAKVAAQKAKPFVQLPAALRGKAFEASFRVIFKRPDQPG